LFALFEYSLCELQIDFTALPKNLRIGKEAIIKKVVGLPIKISEPNFETTNEQQLAIDEISASLDDYHGFLLHGRKHFTDWVVIIVRRPRYKVQNWCVQNWHIV
jgi:hypothetical protein